MKRPRARVMEGSDMYQDFTNSAEAIRRERYRARSSATSRPGRDLQNRIGHALMRMGARLIDSPVLKTDIEVASV